jgi:transposase InsO family protein
MSVRAAGDKFRVCRATVRKWVKRYRAEGRKGLETRSSAPVRRPRQTPPDVEKQIKELRLERMTGLRIAQELKLPRSTVGAVLRRLGMQRRPPLEPKKPLIRYEHKACGDLVHFDVKKLRQFDEPGRRYIDEGGKRKRGAKHDFVHACEDDYSRVADADVMHGEAATDCIDFLVRSIAFYKGKGVTVRRILTDNAPGYRSNEFAEAVEKLGIKHTFTAIRRPQTNGKVERFIQTMSNEWAFAKRYRNSQERNDALPAWLYEYNYVRLHSAIGYKTPASRLPR